MSGTITEDGAAVEFVAHYWRHHVERREPFDTIKGAAMYLVYGEDEGELSAHCVEGPDGKTILDQAAVFQLQIACGEPGFRFDEWLMRTQPALTAR